MRPRSGRGLHLLVLLFALAGCKGEDPPPARGKPSLTDTEIERGRSACRSYAERICACAKSEASLAEECELAQGRPEALELSLRALSAAADRPEADRWALEQNTRRIMEQCVKVDLELDPQRCPR